MLESVMCRLGGHRVDRGQVWHDALDFRGTCHRCSQPLIRDVQSGWREFDGCRDHPELRKPDPRHA